MEQVPTNGQFTLFDELSNELPLNNPVWIDLSTVRLDIEVTTLDPAGLFTLVVGREAIALDGTTLDGDDDGVPGEADDEFSVKFTGSDEIVKSRLPEPEPQEG